MTPIDLAPSGAEDALDHLVNQFADPLAFLRELVQNSIDAGSAEIEVRCDFEAARPTGPIRSAEPTEEPPGTMIIRVEDWGCGMDRQVIDHKLTRLFSSDKEGDRTKIGKFGIGFVSVFALRPDAVCVDTGRAGENWRVLFRGDRSFTRIRLQEAVEGTKIQIIKTMTRSEAILLAQRVKKALRFYCRHVQIELRYAGELVSGPLALAAEGDSEGLIQVEERDPAMHVLVGFTPPQRPDLAGYYNRGLTLLEQPSELPGISFKVDSPQLEHTLSRDAVIKDQNYHRAMATVRRLSAGPLLERLSARLEEALLAEEPDERLRPLQQLLARYRQRLPLPPGCGPRLCARSPYGTLVTLERCQAAADTDWLFTVDQPSPLAHAIIENGMVVLESWQSELVRALYEGSDPPQANAVYVLPLRPSMVDDPKPGDALRAETLALLRGIGAAITAVEIGHLAYPGAAADPPPAVAQDRPFELSERRETQLGAMLMHGRKRTLVINRDHATVRSLLPLAACEPELSAYTMAKLCLLGAPLTAQLDGRLMTLALERRCRRQGT